MPAKKAAKKGGKKKAAAAAYDTSAEALKEMGVQLGELVRTPLGATGRVLGMR